MIAWSRAVYKQLLRLAFLRSNKESKEQENIGLSRTDF